MTDKLPFCECGCGERVAKLGNKFRHGHNQRGIPTSEKTRKKIGDANRKPAKKYTSDELPLCKCGCGKRVIKPWNKFVNGHQSRGRVASLKAIEKMSKAKKGIPYSKNNKKLRSKEKEPLPQGYEIGKESNMVVNKNCAQYLGCYIAEQVLAKIFKNTQRMPFGNIGFDFICNNGYKIDVKSSATGYRGSWQFQIGKNTIADYFLCMAFDDRKDLIPVHLWLIPGKDVNHNKGIQISKSTIQRWAKYEQPIDKVIECCNEMKNK